MDINELAVELQKLGDDCDDTGRLTCALAVEKLERRLDLGEVDEKRLLSEILQRTVEGRLSESTLEMIRTVTKKPRQPKKPKGDSGASM